LYLTPEDMVVLRAEPLYLKYAGTQWSSLTATTVLADLNAIQNTSLETLPIIKYLLMILKQKTLTDTLGEQEDTQSNTVNALYQGWYENPTTKVPIVTKTNITDFDVHLTTATLSSGSLANHSLYAPGASKKYCIYYMDVFSEVADFDYAFTFEMHQEDGSKLWKGTWSPANGPRVPLNWVGTVDDKDAMVDIADGAGAELLHFRTAGGKWS